MTPNYFTVCIACSTLQSGGVFVWLLSCMGFRLFRLKEFYKRVHAAAKNLHSYQQMRIRYYNHNVNVLMNKLSATDRVLFNFDMSSLSWDHYFYKYLRGLRVYLMGNRLHTPGKKNKTLNSLNRYFISLKSHTILIRQ